MGISLWKSLAKPLVTAKGPLQSFIGAIAAACTAARASASA
jgi:hypothetical protein